ncbi:MAG: hypothetical protein JXN10_12170 [Clostridia bacterium]|nr:hypothetical protein [Clostridia bacterium]
MSIELIISLAVQIFTVGLYTGVTLSRIKTLEKKQEKHNNLAERVIRNESCNKNTKEDIEEIKESIGVIQKDVGTIKLTCAERGATKG